MPGRFISPIVALYAIFALGYQTAGPSFWWAFLVVAIGQVFVALVFAELVSKWPIEGSIYQWTTRLLGRGPGWAAGWIYMWVLVNATAILTIFAAQHLSIVFGWSLDDTGVAILAWFILCFGTVVNIAGRMVLKVLMAASIVAECLGSVGLSIWLLMSHREHSVSVLTSGFDHPDYFSLSGPFVLGMAFVAWSFVGFESAGSIAEEVKEPRRTLPKAILFSLVFIALIVMLSALSIILAIPDSVAATSADPVYDTLALQLGTGAAKFMEVLITISFLAAFLALQTAASRLIWSYARDRALPASHVLARLTEGEKQPLIALLVATTIGSVIIALSTFAPDAVTLLLNFNSGGFYLAFLFPLVGSLYVRARGRWVPGPYRLGRLSNPISVIAVCWVAFMFVNIAWPRNAFPETPYLNWSVVLTMSGLAVLGTFVYWSCRDQITEVVLDDAGNAQPEHSPSPAPVVVQGAGATAQPTSAAE